MPGVDLVIVAGDTCEGALRAFEHLRRIVPMHIPIVMVMGNDEYYGRFIWHELTLARSHAGTFNIRLLECNTAVLRRRHPLCGCDALDRLPGVRRIERGWQRRTPARRA